MVHRAVPCVVALHQRVTRAWHFQVGIVAGGAQESPGEGGFSGTQWPFQQDRISGSGKSRYAGGEGGGGGEVGQCNVSHPGNVPQPPAAPQHMLGKDACQKPNRR